MRHEYVVTKKLIMINSILILCGCSISPVSLSDNSAGELYYSVSIINDGNDEIEVFPFKLNNIENMSVDVGVVMAGGTAGMGKFYYRPDRNHIIKWRDIETGKISAVNVIVDLPNEFDKKNGSTIRFIIDPNAKSVRVVYQIYNERNDGYFEVE